MLESNRVVVAPLAEAVGRPELEGLQSLGSKTGDVLAFDIETSSDTLKEESHFAAMATSAERTSVRSGRSLDGRLHAAVMRTAGRNGTIDGGHHSVCGARNAGRMPVRRASRTGARSAIAERSGALKSWRMSPPETSWTPDSDVSLLQTVGRRCAAQSAQVVEESKRSHSVYGARNKMVRERKFVVLVRIILSELHEARIG